jgi:hypothetical protein
VGQPRNQQNCPKESAVGQTRNQMLSLLNILNFYELCTLLLVYSEMFLILANWLEGLSGL